MGGVAFGAVDFPHKEAKKITATAVGDVNAGLHAPPTMRESESMPSLS
jgi:hypothetical protein